METKVELLYYCAGVSLFCLVGAIVNELYESTKKEEEEPINVKNIIIGSITGSITLIGTNITKDKEFNKKILIAFLFGLFGTRIMGELHKINLDLETVLYIILGKDDMLKKSIKKKSKDDKSYKDNKDCPKNEDKDINRKD